MKNPDITVYDSVRDHQVIEGFITRPIKPTETPEHLCDYIEGEIEELREALREESLDAIASEVADLGILFFALCNVLQIDAATVLSAKQHRNAQKYNPFNLQQLIDQGMSGKEAMKILKEKWDREKDKDYYLCQPNGVKILSST